MQKAWLTFILLTLAAQAIARDRYLIVGGGPTPEASKVSMEKNAIWFDEILRERSFDGGRTLYASGDPTLADVALHNPDDPTVQRWMPLARLNPSHINALTVYRPHQVTWAEAGANKQSVESAIASELKNLQPQDSLLVLYSGHGSHEPADVSHNALRLWGETHVDVRDFQQLLTKANPASTVRYVLPQCFSGAFARSITPDPANPSIDGVTGNHCGFFAVSERVIAEGCTPGVEIGEYRDYSTYFFAALNGTTRSGQPLEFAPDLDHDGRVTFSEAHFYAYTEGASTDVPRSTSDYYLELWEPWYTRWQSFVDLDNSGPYLRAAKRLATRLELNANSVSELGTNALNEQLRLQKQITTTTAEQTSRHTAAEKLRKSIRYQFLLHWPKAEQAGSASYQQFVEHEANAALVWIQQQPQYPELVQLQDQVSKLSIDILELQRKQAQYARITRALRLAAIRENFERLATKQQHDTYNALTSCESWSLPHAREAAATSYSSQSQR